MNNIETMKLALEALDELHTMVWVECPSLLNEDSGGDSTLDMECREAITSLRQAIEQAQQAEPVSFSCLRCVTPKKCAIHGCSPNTWPSEASPPRQPLTDEEIEEIIVCLYGTRNFTKMFAQAIEAAHGIKGKA